MLRILLWMFVLSLLVPTVAQEGDMSVEMDAYLDRLSEWGYMGSVLIAQDGDVVLQQGYGIADTRTDIPIESETVFGIGSITKAFTQAAILLLEQDGLLHRDDTLGMYFDDIPADKEDITIDQVVNMQGGFQAYHDDEGDFKEMSRDEAQERILTSALVAEPGTEEVYSNSGYTLLAILIENVSGQSYQAYVRSAILEPLGLNNTGFWGEEFAGLANTPNQLNRYGNAGEWFYSWVLVGSGGMVSTVGDLYTFAQAVLGSDDFIDPEIKATSRFADGVAFVAGGGDATQYVAAMYYNAELGEAVVSLSNQNKYSAEAVGEVLTRSLMGDAELVFPPAVITPPDADQAYEDIVGSYAVADGEDEGELSVELQEGQLMVSVTGQSLINRLANFDPTETAAVNERAMQIYSAALGGDYELLAETLQLPVEEVAEQETSIVTQLEDDLGAFQGFDILGTAPHPVYRELATTFRLSFENGEAYVRWAWQGETIVGVGVFLELPGALQYQVMSIAENSFASYDLATQSITSFIFDDDKLVITALDTEIEFTRDA